MQGVSYQRYAKLLGGCLTNVFYPHRLLSLSERRILLRLARQSFSEMKACVAAVR